jgi:hypothetical protein
VITPICNNNFGCGQSNPGIVVYEEHIYQGTLTLQPCAAWTISYGTCCRNGAISTISNPGGQSFYVETRLNNVSYPTNSSPVFGNTPNTLICVNQPFAYNNGVSDPNGNSLKFSLVPAKVGPGATSNVPYTGGFSATQPFPGTINLNSTTGALTGTATQISIAVVAIRVTEYDPNGNVIGWVTRDIQVQTYTCSNNIPTASPTVINDTACTDQPYTVVINSNDSDPKDIIGMTYGGEIAAATFTVANNNSRNPFPTGTFSWTPTQSDLGSHSFTVTVQDTNCPVNGINVYTYNIFVENCCDSIDFNVRSCCDIELRSKAVDLSTLSPPDGEDPFYAPGDNLPESVNPLPDPDSCNPCVKGWYPVWLEDDQGNPIGFNDPCFTIEWLDDNKTVIATGWAFRAQPDTRYYVRATDNCNGCTSEKEFYYCCGKPDPGFDVTTRCTADGFEITVNNITPSSNSLFLLYTATSPCVGDPCLLDPSNPDQVLSGNSVTFVLPKIAGAMYMIKHGEWTICDPWGEVRKLVMDTCCQGSIQIKTACDCDSSENISDETRQQLDLIAEQAGVSHGDGPEGDGGKCFFCENPDAPFIIYAFDDQGNLLDPNVYQIQWSSSTGLASNVPPPNPQNNVNNNWILAFVEEEYYLEVTGPDGCTYRDTFLVDCCPMPENPRCIDGVLHWDPVPTSWGYSVEIYENDPACCKKTGFGTVYQIGTVNPTLNPALYGIGSCYSWRVQAICPLGGPSDLTPSQCSCGDSGNDPSFKTSQPQGNVLKAYPSPASQAITVEGGILQQCNTIELLDYAGRSLLKQAMGENEGKHTLDVQALPNGTYFIQVSGENQHPVSVPVVIMH